MKREPKTRQKKDQYFSPPSLIDVLLQYQTIPKDVVILEPSTGQGALARRLEEFGHLVITADIDETLDSHFPGNDYLKGPLKEKPVDWVVTNPPYIIGPAFVRQALNQAREGVAMFLRLSFMEPCNHAKRSKRVDLLTEEINGKRLSKIIVHPRIAFRGSSKDRYICCWFIWTRGHIGPAALQIHI